MQSNLKFFSIDTNFDASFSHGSQLKWEAPNCTNKHLIYVQAKI